METAITLKQQNNQIDMVDFYNEATEDSEFWSKDYNIHFDYFIPFKTNPFSRDSMFNEMNRQVLKRLKVSNKTASLIDLGCGMGGTMRYALNNYGNLKTFGVTFSNFQVNKGNSLLKGMKGTITNEDYNHTSYKSNSFDAATAIESFCHSGHSKKSIKEAYRILKPNGKLVIAYAFLNKDEAQLSFVSRLAYQNLCNH